MTATPATRTAPSSPRRDGAAIAVVDDARVLLVDDDPLMLELGQRVLERAGYRRIETLRDPRRVVERCRSLRPDVLLLDLQMPELNGFEVMGALKESGIDPLPAVVMVTGEQDSAMRAEAYERGAHDFVEKPFKPRELLARVGNAAASVMLTRRLEAAVAERTERLEEALEVLRQAEAQLTRQLDHSRAECAAKAALLTEVVHELRTPLNAVLGYSEMLKDQRLGPIGNPEYVRYAGHVHQAGRHLLDVVDGFLNLARAESGEEALDLAPVDVGALVTETADLLRVQASARGVELDVRIAPDLAELRTDRVKLRQIILNLGSNAVKYTPQGGRVTIEAQPAADDGVVILIVRDTGIGFSPAQAAKVMQPFGRTPEAKVMAGGTGLGLPLTRRYVEILGGTLELASVPGKGTVVTVRLPSVPLPAARPHPTEA